MIDFKLSGDDLDMIDEYTKFGEYLYMVSSDIYKDIVSLLYIGPDALAKFLVPFEDLYQEASRRRVANEPDTPTYNQGLEKLFQARRDIVEFSMGDLFRDVYESNKPFEEKAEILLKGMEEVLRLLMTDPENLPPGLTVYGFIQNPKSAPKDAAPEKGAPGGGGPPAEDSEAQGLAAADLDAEDIETDEAPAASSAQGAGGEGSEDDTEGDTQGSQGAPDEEGVIQPPAMILNLTPYKAYGHILDSLVPPRPKGKKKGNPSDNSGRSNEESDIQKKDILDDLRNNIAKLVRRVFGQGQYNIFDLAKNFYLSYDRSKRGEWKDKPIGDSLRIRPMRNMSDLYKVQLNRLFLPDEILGMKIMKKELLVTQYRKRQDKRQLVYVLADISYSMAGETREHFMKAVLLSIGRKTLEDEGRLFFRFFNDGYSAIFELSDRGRWTAFVDTVLSIEMDGGTDVHQALYKGGQDIEEQKEIDDKTELVLITDGTEWVEPTEIKERVKAKRHCILLEQPRDGVLDGYKAAFDNVLVSSVPTLMDARERGLEFTKCR